MKSRVFVPAACCLLATSTALATPPVGVTTSFERIESVSYSTVSTTVAGVEQTSSEWRVGLGTGGGYSYSMPRTTLEYAWQSGLSVGFCIGLSLSWSKTKVSTNASLIEPRIGYIFELGSDVLFWPRLGLTLRELKGPAVLDASHTALTLELPFMLMPGQQLGSPTVGPFLDLGLGGGKDDVDQKVSEFGLAVGFQFR